ncbi:MAG: cysteine hydrolase [Clostridia bacterium]|nr:cysteine hydrolase [Clostridia bacterium]
MKNILVVIDAQNDFIDGSLRNEEAIKAVPNLVAKIRNSDWDAIFVTQDTHSEDYLDTPEGKKLPVVHCVEDTPGWDINSDVQAALTDAAYKNIDVIYIPKPTFGSFDLVTELDSYVFDNIEDDEEVNIVFVGFCTDICVVSNALLVKTDFYADANIIVDASCCAGVTPESHKAALLTMKMCQIDVINE